MSKQQEIKTKVREFTEAVAAADGSVMIIGVVDGEAEDEKVIIGALHGKGSDLVDALTHILTSEEHADAGDILRVAISKAAVRKMSTMLKQVTK